MSVEARLSKLERESKELRRWAEMWRRGIVPANRLYLGSQDPGYGQGDIRIVFVRAGATTPDTTEPYIGYPGLGSSEFPALHFGVGSLTAQAVQTHQALMEIHFMGYTDSTVIVSASWTPLALYRNVLQGDVWTPPVGATHAIAVAGQVTVGGGAATLRCRDITNGTTLWTLPAFGTSDTIETTTTVSNWPTNKAQIQIEAQSSVASNTFTHRAGSWWVLS